jgi:hypothetical protein
MGNGHWSRVDGRNQAERRRQKGVRRRRPFDRLRASGLRINCQASAETVPDAVSFTFFPAITIVYLPDQGLLPAARTT